ncbi:MAG: nucleotidyl transferase AbiEii/AbiGii toxin family protein [Lachnospiraceae bacterium]|nr:nucleotidyl transferase AbiEii/AbiGii toxin family protein [Lachnospiraceae bacterium]
MPQYNRTDLDSAARSYGFTRDTFEKVLRLKEILAWIRTQDFLRQHLLLKGGTAINLTVFELPRLSVDIDMDFTPNSPREDMLVVRAKINKLIRSYMESEGYSLLPASRFHHSLDAFHYTYRNAAGNPDMIKIELNYSLRAHIFEPTERILTTDAFGGNISVLTVDPMEIFAAKANALLSRAAARDLYDFNNMINRNLFDGQSNLFRKCIIFYASISQDSIDSTFRTTAIDTLTFQKIRRDLFPVLTQEERHQKFNLDSRKLTTKDYIQSLMIPTATEKEYMDRFGAKEYQPQLLFDNDSILQRLQDHPMALWKCR